MARKLKAESHEDWYASEEGRRGTLREFERALKGGTVLRSRGKAIRLTDSKVLAALVEQARAKATKAISIRLPVVDLDQAQKIAAREGIGYQTVLKRAIRAGLRKVS